MVIHVLTLSRDVYWLKQGDTGNVEKQRRKDMLGWRRSFQRKGEKTKRRCKNTGRTEKAKR